jgi:hypothetical protein
VILTSNGFGKVTMVCEALTLIVYTVYMNDLFQQVLIPDTLMWITVIMMAVTTASYWRHYRKVLASHPTGHQTQSSPTRIAS